MKHFIFFILLLFSMESFAQDNQSFTISGSVKDTLSKKPIEGVTIAIVKAKDSSLAKISSTDKEGNFSFENLSSGTYRILSTAMGYKKTYSQILIIEGSNINIGTIFLNTEVTSLKEVVVVVRSHSSKERLIKQ